MRTPVCVNGGGSLGLLSYVSASFGLKRGVKQQRMFKKPPPISTALLSSAQNVTNQDAVFPP